MVGGDANEMYFPQQKYCGSKWHMELLMNNIYIYIYTLQGAIIFLMDHKYAWHSHATECNGRTHTLG